MRSRFLTIEIRALVKLSLSSCLALVDFLSNSCQPFAKLTFNFLPCSNLLSAAIFRIALLSSLKLSLQENLLSVESARQIQCDDSVLIEVT